MGEVKMPMHQLLTKDNKALAGRTLILRINSRFLSYRSGEGHSPCALTLLAGISLALAAALNTLVDRHATRLQLRQGAYKS